MSFRRATHRDYHAAYASEETTPAEVLDATLRAIDATQALPEPLGAFIELRIDAMREAAEASTARWKSGTPIGPLDGVPIAIKDEFDIVGYRTRAGTSFKGRTAAAKDATAVARLRAAGAVLLGKTHMTELGIGGTGLNAHHPAPRNPFDPRRMTGGSSSGSAAAVASGLCPVALGSDAGGSIRMPAALCGIYGLKPTYGRIPTTGGALLSWSLDHLGPLGASVADLAAFYDATAGTDDVDPMTIGSPKVDPLGEILDVPDLAGRRFAWCPEYADDADDDVREAFHRALDALRKAGATVEAIELEWAEETRKVGYVTFCVESAAGQREWLATNRRDYNLDTRLILAIGERVSAVEYLNAQRVRTLIRDEYGAICQKYDAFLNPTLASVAPLIEGDDREAVVDTAINAAVARYTFSGTLTGFPALSLPCGSGRHGLPVGLQMMASPWHDSRLLELSAAVDREMPAPIEPEIFVRPLAR